MNTPAVFSSSTTSSIVLSTEGNTNKQSTLKTAEQRPASYPVDSYKQSTASSKKSKQKEPVEKPWLTSLLIGGSILGLGILGLFLHPEIREKVASLFSSASQRSSTPKTAFQIIKELPSDLNPDTLAFFQNLPAKLSNNRSKLIEEVEQLVDMRIIDAGNFSATEMELALKSLIITKKEVNRHPVALPNEAKYILFGHGMGRDENWVFDRGAVANQSVQTYVNETLAQGEKIWAVVCETGTPKNVFNLEGKWVISAGVSA